MVTKTYSRIRCYDNPVIVIYSAVSGGGWVGIGKKVVHILFVHICTLYASSDTSNVLQA